MILFMLIITAYLLFRERSASKMIGSCFSIIGFGISIGCEPGGTLKVFIIQFASYVLVFRKHGQERRR